MQYESRLWWLLYTAPCLSIGLIGFAWTSSGPPLHWMGTMVFSAIVGIANYSIYMTTIDYMVCAYGPYSASATGGNGFARDLLAGVLTVPATPFYSSTFLVPLVRPLEYELTNNQTSAENVISNTHPLSFVSLSSHFLIRSTLANHLQSASPSSW